MKGIDWFAFDGNGAHPGLKAARAAGVTYAYVRTSFSSIVDDFDSSTPGLQDAASMLDQIETAGMVAGAYLMPDYRKGGASAREQAQAFKAHCGLRPGRLPAIIDVEFGQGGIRRTGRTRPEIALFLGDLLDEIELAFPGMRPIAYGSRRVCDDNDFDTLAGVADSVLARCDWFVARYPFAYRIDVQLDANLPAPPVPRAAGDADNWLDHQYQGDGFHLPGFAGAVDVNRWNPLTASSPNGLRKQRAIECLRAALGDRFAGDLDKDLRTFQLEHGLVVDGIVGPATHAWLGWCRPVTKPAVAAAAAMPPPNN